MIPSNCCFAQMAFTVTVADPCDGGLCPSAAGIDMDDEDKTRRNREVSFFLLLYLPVVHRRN